MEPSKDSNNGTRKTPVSMLSCGIKQRDTRGQGFPGKTSKGTALSNR